MLRFIGSTTENPYFAVNNAILSRVRSIYEFKVLDKEDIFILLKRTLADEEKGLGNLHVSVEDSTLMILADMAGGDGRIALDTLGFIVNNLNQGEKIMPQIIEEAMQQRTFFYDKREDKYNLLSALQKSVRGSDPDGAIHYLARLMEGGTDIQLIGRRLLVMASEDVGMAYPNAISIVTSCVQAALMVGYPEAKINLAQAVITMAAAPKSNRSYMALVNATTDLKKVETGDVPDWLKDAHYTGAKKRGLGMGYQNPHDFGGYVEQQYLPDSIKDRTYYAPTENGTEASFKKYLENLKKK